MCEKVTSVESFFKQLPELREKIKGDIFYRGQNNEKYKIIPSVFRGNMGGREHEIYNEVMTECAHEFYDCKTHNEILSKMQHYGVPTRLLDVTTNALVALYFACEGKSKANGAVYVLKTDELKIKQYDSDVVSILSALPRFNCMEKKSMVKVAKKYSIIGKRIIEKQKQQEEYEENIANFNAIGCIKRLLHEIKKENPAFENIINPDDLLANFFFIPLKMNARIIRQSGAFVIFGLQENAIQKDLNNTSGYSVLKKIIVENSKKDMIITQLSCFGISKATLHPELYKVAEYIKEK